MTAKLELLRDLARIGSRVFDLMMLVDEYDVGSKRHDDEFMREVRGTLRTLLEGELHRCKQS